MALAFDPNLLQRHKTSTNKYISIYRKREGKGIKGRIQEKAGNLQPIKVSISETIGGNEPIAVKWRGQRMFCMKGWISGS